MEWSELMAELTGICRIATVGADGKPHVAKVFTRADGAVLWIATVRSSKKARNIAACPSVALTWDPQSEIYLDGTAELIDDPEVKQRLWTMLPYDPSGFFGSPANPELVFVKITPSRAVRIAMRDGGLVRERWAAGR